MSVQWNFERAMCLFRATALVVALYCARWGVHGGVNTKLFDTSAGVALMYVTASSLLPFLTALQEPPPLPQHLAA